MRAGEGTKSASSRASEHSSPSVGTQFTCFTGIEVQILTCYASSRAGLQAPGGRAAMMREGEGNKSASSRASEYSSASSRAGDADGGVSRSVGGFPATGRAAMMREEERDTPPQSVGLSHLDLCSLLRAASLHAGPAGCLT
jgi:hypothetical protein